MHAISQQPIDRDAPLADDLVQELFYRLENFFNGSNPSVADLHGILQEYQAASSTAAMIIDLFSRCLITPMSCIALDKAAEFLQLHMNDELARTLDSVRLDATANERQYATLLQTTIIRDFAHLFKLLLLSGCNPNSKLSDKKTPLAIAVVSNLVQPTTRLEFIQCLFDRGADPLLADIYGVTPFQRLCGLGSFRQESSRSTSTFFFSRCRIELSKGVCFLSRPSPFQLC